MTCTAQDATLTIAGGGIPVDATCTLHKQQIGAQRIPIRYYAHKYGAFRLGDGRMRRQSEVSHGCADDWARCSSSMIRLD